MDRLLTPFHLFSSMQTMKFLSIQFSLITVLLLGACSKAPAVDSLPEISYADLLTDLFNPQRIMRSDLMDTELLSSYDRTGGNNDYSYFPAKGPNGWVVLADVKGPGVMTRFWFTGARDGSQPLRIYFDGSDSPGIDTTVGEFCGGTWPNLSPLAAYENYCWFNMIPIPFKQRMVVMMPNKDVAKLYYQMNISRPPKGSSVAAYTDSLMETHRSQLDGIRAQWAADDFEPLAATESFDQTVQAGDAVDLISIEGAGVMQELRIHLDRTADPISFLRDHLVQVYYEGQEQPSVLCPLGDLFGVMWKPMAYRSQYFGLEQDELILRFPAPFQKSLRIRILNQGPSASRIKGGVSIDPKADVTGLRYLHAVWQKSPAQVTGRPHTVLDGKGRGHLAGCLLSVTGHDRSWWILESDESMYRDGESAPSWQGTGLEDYFNGGWYYQNALARPTHGIVFKAPFRTIQYRLHSADPVQFEESLRMEFEKGPEMRSKGVMESVAWYYLDTPAEAVSDGLSRSDRAIPVDPVAEATIMHEILNLERLGDFSSAASWIDHYLASFASQARLGPVLNVRKLGYRIHEEGFTAVEQDLLSAASDPDPIAAKQAQDLIWLQEDPLNALLGVYSNFKTEISLDGRTLTTVQEPKAMKVFRVKLGAGEHVLGLALGYQSYPSWVQVSLQNRDGLIGTQSDWRYHTSPATGWNQVGFSDADWAPLGGTGVKGPPEAPYVWLEPNAFLGLQSGAVGVRVDDHVWHDKRKPAYIRKQFSWPPAANSKSAPLDD